MGISIRHYVIEETGSLKRIPRRITEALVFGEDAIPGYAGTRQRIATAVIENEGAKAVRILDVQGSFWEFDEDGRINEGLQQTVGEAMSFAFESKSGNGKVVDIIPEIKRRQFHANHRWDPTKDEIDRLAADIWPAFNGAASSEIKTVKGKAPKKPPLTYEAKEALREISEKIGSIAVQLEFLKEPALKGLAFEARRTAESREEPALWRGVADECDRRREILARHRTGKGVWYAVVEIFYKEEASVSRSVDLIFKKCQGRDAAVETARKLIVENAHKFSDVVSVVPDVYCDLEWTPPDD